jgi:ribosomal protein S1
MSKITGKIVTGTGNNLGFEIDAKNEFALVLEAFEKVNPMCEIKAGKQMSGILTQKNNKYSLININGKSDVFIDNNIYEKNYLDNISIGEKVDFIILDVIDGKQYEVTGSIHQAKMIEAQDFLTNAVTDKIILTGTPKELNHAGYTVEVNINELTISLFMPHLLTDVNKLPNPESIIDTEINFLVESNYKDGKNSFIASRKAYLLSRAKTEIKNIVKDEVYCGYVTGVTDFAVFVQFNECLTGMIHKTNLSEQAISMLENNEIRDGMNIEFYVKDVIIVRNEVKLFLTQVLRESLWDSIEVNQELTGVVSSIKDFGVFVSLDYETKGLLHKSVLNDNFNKYKKGDNVIVIVTALNKNNRQITLALK